MNGQVQHANRPRFILEIAEDWMAFAPHPRTQGIQTLLPASESWPPDPQAPPPTRMTSQRTSRPRTTKKSNPVDKGKGKEKRPAEAEAESRSDSELEEAFRKESFFDGMHNRKFNEEKQFNLNKIDRAFLDILHQIKDRYWEIFTFPLGRTVAHHSMSFMRHMGLLRSNKKQLVH
ncbi:hypothetical protein HAX54_016038 [Datura stramonium]|uniref:Uncharacterized protein n=1 Tax=Datura stramonium TaxID=4076 RepID=A0ABS8UI84_DATST|nr:hypothetical protein [Datura stramonium]